jgi:hypothetical protein
VPLNDAQGLKQRSDPSACRPSESERREAEAQHAKVAGSGVARGAEFRSPVSFGQTRIDVALIREAAKRIDMTGLRAHGPRRYRGVARGSSRGVRVRIWRDASQAARLGEFDVEAQLGDRGQGLEAAVVAEHHPLPAAEE